MSPWPKLLPKYLAEYEAAYALAGKEIRRVKREYGGGLFLLDWEHARGDHYAMQTLRSDHAENACAFVCAAISRLENVTLFCVGRYPHKVVRLRNAEGRSTKKQHRNLEARM
jgi:hypothetical protein